MSKDITGEADWSKLMSSVRRKDLAKTKKSSLNAAGDRTEIERDYDRILFSTPVRRLADKTQVFPLERNDSVRNRLTHSHEVANIARSIGVAITNRPGSKLNDEHYRRDVPAMLAAVGLAHDIGNPPFGHQGEEAIGSWFKKNEATIFNFSHDWQGEENKDLLERMKQDYLRFEGNAQTLRIMTKLQIVNDNFGLNLSCGSLAALMKYPSPSDRTDKENISRKKFGYFHSEQDIVQEVWLQTDLKEGRRHPLTYIMEASDDIAYSVMDVEDAVKKGLVSYRDVVSYLENEKNKINTNNTEGSPAAKQVALIADVLKKCTAQTDEYEKENISPKELNDLSMQMFRVFAVGAMVSSVTTSFLEQQNAIEAGIVTEDLIAISDAKLLCKLLKKFAFENAYRHKTVLELELKGYKVLHSIMDMLWPSIVSRGNPKTQKNHAGTPFEKYAYGRISENYRRVFENPGNELPLTYKRCQLLADMVSGMTDSFAFSFEEELRALDC